MSRRRFKEIKEYLHLAGNRAQKYSLISSNQLIKNTNRCHYHFRFDQKSDILVIKWHNNKPVMTSNSSMVLLVPEAA